MTDCPNGEIRDQLPDLVHDRLAPDRRREVEAHVRGCADCQAELALLRSMRTALRRAAAVDAAAIAASIPAYRAPARRTWGGWRAAAAIVILAVGGGSVIAHQHEQRVETAAPATPSMVAVGEEASPSVPPTAAPSSQSDLAERELAVGSAAVSDLDDSELSALLADLQTLDVLPAAEVENANVVTAAVTTGTN
jgi:anti-sigma factor RsiW